MAATYVQITREEFEDWLNSAPWPWKRDARFQGIYVLRLSNTVGVAISSTVGSADSAMNRGRASGAMRLVSLEHGHTLNRKAMGQKHFARTTNWRTNWKKGVQRIVDAYDKSSSFYDALADIENRATYQKNLLLEIESIQGWEDIEMLSSFHSKVKDGGILTLRQRDALERAPKASQPPVEDERLADLRKLWLEARRDGNQWVMDFAKSMAEQIKRGRQPSQKQREKVRESLQHYRIASIKRIASAFLARMPA